MKEHKINKEENTFLGGWYIPTEICDRLIEVFKNSKHQQGPGMCGGDVRPKAKKSTDITVTYDTMGSAGIEYYEELAKVMEEYKKKYPYCTNATGPWALLEPSNIQWYKPGEGFYVWHSEACQAGDTACRHLTYMTYLNDIKEGGGTEFYHQNVLIKPEKGLTIIAPSTWIHTHRGQVAEKEDKYIITGWYSFHD